jgi:two-component system cell cycle sensor histidine kinase/response regulator CckA
MDTSNQKHYQDLVNNIPHPAVFVSRDCRINLVNDALLEMHGEKRESIIGRPCRSILYHQDIPCQLSHEDCFFKDVFQEGKTVKVTRRHVSELKKELLVDLIASPIRNGDGRIVGMLGVLRDAAPGFRLEEDNRQYLALLSSVLDGIGEGVVVMDREYRILTANKGYLVQAGSDIEDVVGRHCYEVSHRFDSPCTANGHECPVRIVFETGRSAKALHVHYDLENRGIYVECQAYPIRDSSGQVIRAIETINDVTERVLLERKVKESEEKYRDLYDNSPDGYYSLADNGLIVEVNRTFLGMLGYHRDEVVGKQYIESLLAGESVQICRTKFPELKKRGRMTNLELNLVRKGGSLLPVMMNATAVYDGDGAFIVSRCMVRDISDRKEAEEERRRLQEQLFQSQKLEALGKLAGGVAHDFNNLLASILGYASLAKTDLAEDDPLYRHVDIIETASLRASELTQQLLAFARGGKYDAKPNDANAIVREVAALLSRTVDKSIELNLETERNLRPVICDSGQIQQAILNTCINGRDAMPRGGSLTIRTANVHLEVKDVQYFVDVPPGDYMRITVSDTGIGMDRQTQQHMFEPFFTTKEKGTGLGLSLLYGIIKKHNGFIQVYSEPGKGSTFEINLPACTGEETCVQKGEDMELQRGCGVVLVVDDEPHVTELAGDILRRFGYEVLRAGTGEEAVNLYQQKSQEIVAVVLDIVMPGMDGREVFKRLRTINPGAKVIVSSGYSHDRDADDLLEQGAAGFVQKPYRIAELVRVVNETVGVSDGAKGQV